MAPGRRESMPNGRIALAGRPPHIQDIRHQSRRSMELSMNKRFSLAMLLLSLAVPAASAGEPIEVSLGLSQIIGPVTDMSTVIIGDDGVAEITLGGGGTIIVTGRSIGTTNLIILDEAGRELLDAALNVVSQDRRPTTNITVVKGFAKSQGYVCMGAAACVPVKKGSPPTLAAVEGDDGAASPPLAVPNAPAVPATPAIEVPAEPEQLTLNP
jgi:hypothetical protein